jgi:hypothetical protein
MKRFISLFAVAALLCQAAFLIAQTSDEPSTQSVLDAARAKYWQDKSSEDQSEGQSSDSAGGEVREPVGYTPFLISFVPGVSVPFGYYDTSIAGGAIGNLTRDINGVEGASVFNLSRDIHGLQAAGVFNLARNVTGFQSAGVFNMVDRDFSGFQGAGVFNIVNGRFAGFQGAGVFNIGNRVFAPFQGAGVFNLVDEVYGFQAAGVFNIAGTVVGGQAAGVFNIAKRVNGVQLGVVNIADHIDGVQLGLINIAGNGVGSLGVTYEPLTNFFFAHLQAGTPYLYTVAGLGAASQDWGRNLDGFVASLGLGSRTRLLGLNIDLDVSGMQTLAGLPRDQAGCENWNPEAQNWFRPFPSIRLMAGLPLGGHLQLVGGLTADVDFDSLGNRVPEALKTSSVWRAQVFGESFSAYYKWFFGLKI